MIRSRFINEEVLRILDPASTGETIPRTEDLEKLFVRETLLVLLCADLAGEHRGELLVEGDQLLCHGETLGLERVEHFVRCAVLRGESVEGVDEFPGEVVGIHH